MAKLYGYEDSPPDSFELEREPRWVMLTADALWHADDVDANGDADGELGMLELKKLKEVHLDQKGSELVVASKGKCHLFTVEPGAAVGLEQWRDAIKGAMAAS